MHHLSWQRWLGEVMGQESAFMYLQQSKPQTSGLALADSPLGVR